MKKWKIVLSMLVAGSFFINGGSNVLPPNHVYAADMVENENTNTGGIVMSKETFDKENLFGIGQPNDAYAKFFVGNSYLNELTNAKECGISLANVTFEPGCRNNWHIHHASKGGGQILLCIAGSGWYQEEGKEAISLEPGSVVVIRPGVKHWHGAKADSWFSHVAFGVPGENCSNEWCEPVSDEEYNKLSK